MSTTNVTSTPAPIVWPTDPKLYDSTHYVLAAGYCVLALVTATIVVKKLFSGTLKELWKIFFFAFVVAGAIVRGTWAFICPLELSGSVALTNRSDFYLNLSPSFLFFSNYVILLFVWAELYHYHGMTIFRLRGHLAVTLGVMYLVVLVLFLVDILAYETEAVPISSAQNIPQHILIIYLAVLYIATSTAFGVYAYLILAPLARRRSSNAESNVDRARLIRRLLSLTLLIVFFFLFRAAMVFVGFFNNWSVINWFDLVYYGVCEILPLFLMLFILLYRPAKANVQEKIGYPTDKTPLVNN